ncbi:MAG TPA: iron-containing alcohol dehydrogenase, partial [Candidatus Hydrogenedentes bacterium]|nr:iron-containing alcohol dehydrogenase [Candidatus Hydrogenedentota bacterium]
MDTKTFFIPTRVAYGAGSFAQLGGLCAPLGTRPFIVTGRRSARESGLLDRVLAVFPEAVVFDEVEENPGVAVCARGGERCRAAACDFVLALGGGSPMDAAKAVAVLARQDAPGSALFSAP